MFIFSKKFLVPFLILFVIVISVMTFQLYWAYRQDILNKGLGFGVIAEWVLYEMGAVLPLAFLAAWIGATSFFMHARARYSRTVFKGKDGAAAFSVAILLFLYAGFVLPVLYYRGLSLLADIVFIRPGEKLVRTTVYDRMPTMLSYNELRKASDSATAQKDLKKQMIISDIKRNIIRKDVDSVVAEAGRQGIVLTEEEFASISDAFNTESAWACCLRQTSISRLLDWKNRETNFIQKVKYLRNKMAVTGLTVVLFFVIGTVLGIGMRKLPGIVPMLVSVFAFFPLWYYITETFRVWYNQQKAGLVVASYGPLALFGILTFIGYLLLKRQENTEEGATEWAT